MRDLLMLVRMFVDLGLTVFAFIMLFTYVPFFAFVCLAAAYALLVYQTEKELGEFMKEQGW